MQLPYLVSPTLLGNILGDSVKIGPRILLASVVFDSDRQAVVEAVRTQFPKWGGRIALEVGEAFELVQRAKREGFENVDPYLMERDEQLELAMRWLIGRKLNISLHEPVNRAEKREFEHRIHCAANGIRCQPLKQLPDFRVSTLGDVTRTMRSKPDAGDKAREAQAALMRKLHEQGGVLPGEAATTGAPAFKVARERHTPAMRGTPIVGTGKPAASSKGAKR